jgi:hypothetical protein
MSPPKLEQQFREIANWTRELARDLSEAGAGIAKVVGWLVSAGFALVIAVSLYQWLDNSGWIPRSHDTPVWIQGDWLVGEYRECDMQTTTPAFEGSHYDAEDINTLPRLFCAKQANGFFDWSETKTGTDTSWQTIGRDFHTLPVSYFGRLERLDKWRISWRCQRNTESLSCKALD